MSTENEALLCAVIVVLGVLLADAFRLVEVVR